MRRRRRSAQSHALRRKKRTPPARVKWPANYRRTTPRTAQARAPRTGCAWLEQLSTLAGARHRLAVFRSWLGTRDRARVDENVERFFAPKGGAAGHRSGPRVDIREARRAAHQLVRPAAAPTRPRPRERRGAQAKPLFNRFLRYACDIDGGTRYTARAAAIAEERGACWVLDWGFAPGGMAELLLAAHPRIHVVGVTLAPETGGNAFPPEFAQGKGGRFTCVIADVIAMARAGERVVDAAAAAGLPPSFPGTFDLVIIGITIHDGDAIGRGKVLLKDSLYLSQLALTWPCLRDGACLLTRMHMSLRLIDLHYAAWMMRHFRGCGNDGGGSGAGAGVAAAAKPASEFAVRKTFWCLWEGFSSAAAAAHGSEARLARAVAADAAGDGAYACAGGRYATPALHDESVAAMLAEYGPALVALLEPAWRVQASAMEGLIAGLKDRFCSRHLAGRCRGPCINAHALGEVIPEILAAMRAVEERARPHLRADEADARSAFLFYQERAPR